jgi:FMN-dependent oxidoreductase (nitrilotriacetate monooxygenase family)
MVAHKTSKPAAKKKAGKQAKPKNKMHFAQFLCHGPTYHSQAMWRHPKTAEAGYDWRHPELYQHIAKVCERGLFDMVFFADLNYISDTYTGTMDPAIRNAAQVPEHDPIPVLGFMAAVTEKVGLGATFSVSHHQPFYAARMWASIDHLTRGRAAWNVVTSVNHNQAANHGEEMQPSDTRYERAHEFMEVCTKLWDSWEADALVQDRETPVFADPSKIHRIEHEGDFFKSRGPLNVTPSPQNGPAIVQAGTSPKGIDLAAKYADGIFAIQPHPESAKKYYELVKEQVAQHGRNPDHCRILFGMQPFIGKSEAHALEVQQEHNDLVPVEGGMAILSAHLDFDLSTLDPNSLMADCDQPQLQRMRTRFMKPDGTKMTVAEVAARHGQSVGLPQFAGTAESIADQMEAYLDIVGGDGFMLSSYNSPGAIEEFVDLVIPILQKRGLYRTEYKGTTQRDHLRQDD